MSWAPSTRAVADGQALQELLRQKQVDLSRMSAVGLQLDAVSRYEVQKQAESRTHDSSHDSVQESELQNSNLASYFEAGDRMRETQVADGFFFNASDSRGRNLDTQSKLGESGVSRHERFCLDFLVSCAGGATASRSRLREMPDESG